MLLTSVFSQQVLFILSPLTNSLNIGESEINIGSVIERHKNVVFYEHSIKVKVNTIEFLETPDILDSILDSIDRINKTLINRRLNLKKDQSFTELENATTIQLIETLKLVENDLEVAKSWFKSSESRTKRNVGIVLSSLTGIAGLGSSIASHIRISNAWQEIEKNSQNIQEIKWNTGINRDKINEIILDLNSIQDILDNNTYALSNLFSYLNLFISLSRIQSKISYFINYIKENIQTIISVSKGTITPAVISTNQLRKILNSVNIIGYKPIFTNLHFYYTIMKTDMEDIFFYINIPVASNEYYKSFLIHPFPTFFNEKLVTLNINATHVLTSNSTTNYIVTKSLDDCIDSPTVLVCPKKTYITFFDWDGNCYLDVIANKSSPVCYFQEWNPGNVKDPIVLFTPDKTYVLSTSTQLFDISCGNMRERRKVSKEIFSVHPSCTISTDTWKSSASVDILHTLHRIKMDFRKETFDGSLHDIHHIRKNIQLLPSLMNQPISHSDAVWYLLSSILFLIVLLAISRMILRLLNRRNTHINQVAPQQQPFKYIFQ